MMVAKVYEEAYQSMTLMLLFLCLVSPSYSRYNDRDINSEISTRKWEKSKQRATDAVGISSHMNLCSKDRDMKLVCHCTPEDYMHIKATKADCWIFHDDFPRNDPNWQAFQTQPFLENLKFTVQRTGSLEYIPTNEIGLLKSLRSINIEYAQIKEINSFAFANLTQLTSLTLPKNQIQLIHSNAFANHPDLEEIDLEQNQIVEIDKNAFIDLPNLTLLNLSRNKITTIHENLFNEIRKLVELRIDSNSISVLTREMFKGLGNLRTLNVSNNNINYIGNTVFAELWGLEELLLDSNHITKLGERAFDGLNVLKTLNLANNELTNMDRGVFTAVPALGLLDLSNNKLETITQYIIEPLLDNLVNATSILDLTGNELMCDCRLRWVFNLSKNTKNELLREVLHRIQCILQPKDHIPSDYFENISQKQSSVMLDDDVQTYYDENNFNVETIKIGSGQLNTVLKMIPEQLPCPQELAQPTELPLQREPINLSNLSWSNKSSCIFGLSIKLVVSSIIFYNVFDLC